MEVSLWKCIKWLFSIHTTPEEFKTAAITSHCRFVLEENSVRKSYEYHGTIAFEKLLFQNQIAGVFKFFCIEERFRKPPFSWQISVDGRPYHRNKAAFSNFRNVRWTLPKWIYMYGYMHGIRDLQCMGILGCSIITSVTHLSKLSMTIPNPPPCPCPCPPSHHMSRCLL